MSIINLVSLDVLKTESENVTVITQGNATKCAVHYVKSFKHSHMDTHFVKIAYKQ